MFAARTDNQVGIGLTGSIKMLRDRFFGDIVGRKLGMPLHSPLPCQLAGKLIGRKDGNELLAERGEPELYEPDNDGTRGAYDGLYDVLAREIDPREVGDVLGGLRHLVNVGEAHIEKAPDDEIRFV